MENMGMTRLFLTICELNPDVNLRLRTDSSTIRDFIISEIHPGKLILPAGYYYNQNGCITNKDKTHSGYYESIGVVVE